MREDVISSFKNLTLKVFGKESIQIKEYADTNFLIYSKYTIDENINESIKRIRDSTTKNKELKEYLLKMITNCKDLNDKNYIEFFENQKNYSERNFKGDDLKIALIGINTGVSSYRYWKENLEKWDVLIGNTNSTQARNTRGVATADVAGALVGGLYGAIGGTAFLPGVGTVAGGLAVGCAGGLYASAVASVKSLLDLF